MSAYSGKYHKGASRERREQKRREASEQRMRAEAREVVEAWAAKREAS
jgi:hypothetical protein